MNRCLTAATALSIALALTFTAGALGSREVVRFGNLFLADNGGIAPTKLPRRGSAPITARLLGEIGTLDGTHPPALRSVSLYVDRTIGIDAVGLPTCRKRQIEATTTATAERVCRGAIVGSGKAEVEVAFPEQTPFSATGPVVLFNGGVHGPTTVVYLHAYVHVPAPTAIVVRATVTRVHHGRFGLHIVAPIPKITGGAGSVTKFELNVGRRFAYRGKKESFLFASCPTGQWVTKGTVKFADDTQLGITHLFPCTPTG